MPARSHFHSCPECYEHVPCELACTIEPDLQDGEKEFGAHCVCDECSRKEPILTQEWWDIYHGFKKKKK